MLYDMNLEKICPSPREDASRVFRVLLNKGIAIIPCDVGYAVIASDAKSLDRIFVAKKRQPHKRHAMIGTYELHREIHNLPSDEENMVRLLTVDLNLPLGVVAPYNIDHPIIKKLSPMTLAQSSVQGTLAMLVNGGQLQEEICRLDSQEELPILGSSANLTGTGTKMKVEDIEAEIKDISDIIIDYGRQKYNSPRSSSTMLDFENHSTLRYGACYDVVEDAMWRFYGIKLPGDPGTKGLFSDHIPSNQWVWNNN